VFLEANGRTYLLPGVPGINYRTETYTGDKSELPVKTGSQVERGLDGAYLHQLLF